MPVTQIEALTEAYRRGLLKPEQRAAAEELDRRGVISLAVRPAEGDVRKELMAEMTSEIWPGEAAAIGAGKGFMNIARGLGLAEEETPLEKESFAALEEAQPVATTAGEIVGEAAPFVPLGGAVSGISKTFPRVAAATALGATEGAIIAEGTGRDAVPGGLVGAGVGLGAEVLFPVIGRMGRKAIQRATGKAPAGAVLDATGAPTHELTDALQKLGLSFDDLSTDAAQVIQGVKPGSKPGQVARKALFAEEGIPATTGEIAGDTLSRAREQELIQTMTPGTEEIRQFKLDQSEKIREALEGVFGTDATKEETGELIQDALTGRKKLLRTRKNELYEQAAEASKDTGKVPIFTDNLSEAIPDADLMEDLAITSPQAITSLDQILTKYGLKEPTEEAVKAGFKPTPLTVENVERFRKTLNAIGKGDQTGSASVAIGPIKEALDLELDNLAGLSGS
jgi:hypothetical protein